MPGLWELILILLIVVVVFGGKKIPEIMGGLGKGIRNFQESYRERRTDSASCYAVWGSPKRESRTQVDVSAFGPGLYEDPFCTGGRCAFGRRVGAPLRGV